QDRLAFSPPAWGWSERASGTREGQEVFPTRVGMVRLDRRKPTEGARFPHPRGDGPIDWGTKPRTRRFSPPAWGWSAPRPTNRTRSMVFPTRVGMVRAGAG